MSLQTPKRDCTLCPRLSEFIRKNREQYPDFFNAPVPCFGSQDAKLMIIGLAPGLRGANKTGRPFTKDFAGDLLYSTLSEFGFSRGEYQADINDGLELTGARIVNAVRCVPPQNKVTPDEIRTCNRFLKSEIEHMPKLEVILTLGTVAHAAILKALEYRNGDFKFGHGALHNTRRYKIINSYHCSKYNTSTKRLTDEMFKDVFAKIRTLI